MELPNTNHSGPQEFTRQSAAAEIPRTNPFLRRLFDMVTGVALEDEPFAPFVDDVAHILAVTDIDEVLKDFGQSSTRDPIFHFYETFLAEYDPELREVRGVYYTPEPVVSYIVRSLDQILRERFACAGGLSDTTTVPTEDETTRPTPRVLILDPACGTGTFLATVIEHIRAQFIEHGQSGQWSSYVREHLLPRLFGFELLMAPYAVAHFKLALKLAGQDLQSEEHQATLSYDFSGQERLGVYLTNTLEETARTSEVLFAQFVAEEANAAASVKRDLPIMVILGNPPYSQKSYNRNSWIETLMEDYKRTVRSEESQIQALSNDYIKFLRFAQWRIDRTNHGVLGFITGHGYINGPQARDMRASLMKSFNSIYILNLHGSVRRSVVGTDDDEPVFQIQQGTAIILAVKDGSGAREVHYSELKGRLSHKFEYLAQKDIATTEWVRADPSTPNFYFVPPRAGSEQRHKEYQSFRSLTDIFGTGDRSSDKEKLWATGFASQQDQFAISLDDDEVEHKIRTLLESRTVDEARNHFRLCKTEQWNYSRAKRELASGEWRNELEDCAFRPFDNRRTVFDRNVVTILRSRVMSLLRGDDAVPVLPQRQFRRRLALVSSRVVNDAHFAHAFVAQQPVDKIFLSTKTSTNAYVFPVYRHSHLLPIEAAAAESVDLPVPNLADHFVSELSSQLGLEFTSHGTGDLTTTFGPEDILHYIYATLHSPTFREHYGDWLKQDFPRVPVPPDSSVFTQLCHIGQQLQELHLLDSPDLETCENPLTSPIRYPEPGPNIVEPSYPKYLPPNALESPTQNELSNGRVCINKGQRGRPGQHFEGVSQQVWDFQVGGHQVCKKWLQERRGRALSSADLLHYQKVCEAVRRTLDLMALLDEAGEFWSAATEGDGGHARNSIKPL